MLILIRYGEIGLKSSQVRTSFIDRLQHNLEQQLQAHAIPGDIVERDDRIFADVHEEDAADAAIAITHVPGVVSASPTVTSPLTLDAMAETALQIVDQDAASFAVDARRAGDHDFTSNDIEDVVGQAIVDAYDIPVDLDDPAETVGIEARYTTAYLYTETVPGVGGLPIDDDDRVAVLMEDRASTVAAYRLMKRGCTVYPVYAGQHPEDLEQDMTTLRQFDPSIKLTVVKDKTPDAALQHCKELYDCDAVAYGHTTDELDATGNGTVLYPNSGSTEEAILQEYATIMHTIV